MKLIPQKPKPPVVIEFSSDEAEKLRNALMIDLVWADTTNPSLYAQFHELLAEGLNANA